ncbi:MAG: stimulus-sensing domain-containing protein [Alphaproteobacteria bacterium]
MVDAAPRYRLVPPAPRPRGIKRALRGLERGVHTHVVKPVGGILPGASRARRRARARTRTRVQAEPQPKFYHRILFRSVAVTMLGVLIFGAGLVYVGRHRIGLVDERIRALTTHSRLISDAIAESALKHVEPRTGLIDPRNPAFDFDYKEARQLLQRQLKATNYRVRIFDKRGVEYMDSADMDSKARVTWYQLSHGGQPLGNWGIVDNLIDWVAGQMRGRPMLDYREERNGLLYEEVRSVLEARSQKPAEHTLRKTEDGRLIVSVAVPISHVQAYWGALLVSTDGTDVEEALRSERASVIQILIVALAVSLLLSLFYAQNIVRPIRQLAKAADRIRRTRPGRGVSRMPLPDFHKRQDEIGDLAKSMSEMTHALYNRIDAIEQFAADVSHEIKNPLTSLRSAVETMGRTQDPRSVQRLIQIVQDDVKRIDRLITDISDASRLDAELSREAFGVIDVVRLLDSIIGVLNETGALRNIDIQLVIETGALHESALQVRGIESRLGQVFRNILDNAMSFSPENSVILVSAALIPDRAAPKVRITIEDEGPGIPEENLDHIFRRFYTQRPAEADFGKNSGLGLSISKQIVEAHHGAIHAENRKRAGGEIAGARFVIVLPLITGGPGRS